tara:strand:- start:297 stop:524 length:228 start_codon:yes stop_codon:yes gene_type:complete
MYNIVEKKKNNKSLYTVVYTYGGLSLPLCQSSKYSECMDYVEKQQEYPEEYSEEEAQQSLHKCLSDMYTNRNNGK